MAFDVFVATITCREMRERLYKGKVAEVMWGEGRWWSVVKRSGKESGPQGHNEITSAAPTHVAGQNKVTSRTIEANPKGNRHCDDACARCVRKQGTLHGMGRKGDPGLGAIHCVLSDTGGTVGAVGWVHYASCMVERSRCA